MMIGDAVVLNADILNYINLITVQIAAHGWMVNMIVKCNPIQPGKERCPLIRFCIARMNDRTITGCGIPLWYAGVIRREQVEVEHTVKGHGTTLHGRKSAKRKKDGGDGQTKKPE